MRLPLTKAMVADSKGTQIVTLNGNSNVEATKKKLAAIRGVTGIEYSYLTHKLRVKFQGDPATVGQAGLEIKKILKGRSTGHQK